MTRRRTRGASDPTRLRRQVRQPRAPRADAMIRASMKAAFLLASLVALSAAASPWGARHNRLVKAEPGVDSTGARSPSQVRLWFKEPPEIAVSSIKVADAAAKPVPTGEVKATEDKLSIAVSV